VRCPRHGRHVKSHDAISVSFVTSRDLSLLTSVWFGVVVSCSWILRRVSGSANRQAGSPTPATAWKMQLIARPSQVPTVTMMDLMLRCRGSRRPSHRTDMRPTDSNTHQAWHQSKIPFCQLCVVPTTEVDLRCSRSSSGTRKELVAMWGRRAFCPKWLDRLNFNRTTHTYHTHRQTKLHLRHARSRFAELQFDLKGSIESTYNSCSLDILDQLLLCS
jgi:hypothetical protein